MAETRLRRNVPRSATYSQSASCIAILVLFGSTVSILIPAQAGQNDAQLSQSGHFRASYASRLQPVSINRIHDGILHVEAANGDAVANARISIDGGMPEHDHGLPTAPKVTRYLGNGDYLVEGLRFHMKGRWELRFVIEDGSVRDTVLIAFTL